MFSSVTCVFFDPKPVINRSLAKCGVARMFLATSGRKSEKGFTLIELMIVVVVVAILAAITMPAYNSYTKKARRGDAKASLLSAQLKQEKWRANHTTYGALSDVWTGTDSHESYYTMGVVGTPDGASFTMTAAPTGAQAGDECGTFAINQDGPLYTGYASADCWGR
jgi:type IV pilus assembly protein PilE